MDSILNPKFEKKNKKNLFIIIIIITIYDVRVF